MIIDDIKNRYKDLSQLYADCCGALDISRLTKSLAQLTQLQHAPDFYKNPASAQKVNAQAKHIEKQLLEVESLGARIQDLADFITLAEEEGDTGFIDELAAQAQGLVTQLDKLYLSTLLTGEYDQKNAILSLHAGAGGTEAQDWVEMLYRMYKMYADKNGYSYEELDYLAGDEAGIKSVTFIIKGACAYGYLKAEKGVHRLVRISPFDSNARRHTSFASLEVMPEIDNDTSVKILPEELKTDTFRAGGAGGQHVNKTESAVRITHLPTGIVVQCQNERSQIQNRETAYKMLLSKLVERRERENAEKAGAISGLLKKIEWGSQIRSYVFQPYTMVKDHRTQYEETDVPFVMNGGLDGFIFEYLKKSRAQ
ncbi:MAG: peptide chain release factor 2 [Firmicutes bacterium]|nr:peptide chain release factor 2 [Bacillota bacterium]